MLVISSFEQTESLEVAIVELKKNGITKDKILAVPFEKRRDDRKLFDSIQRADGLSLFDVAAALGTVFAVLGASYGFVLTWGPIIWGLIGCAFGAVLGFIIDFFMTKRKTKESRKLPNSFTEVVLIVECNESKSEVVQSILWANLALGVAQVQNNTGNYGAG